MHVLIIGGTRFVGYQLAWRLVEEGHRVTTLNRGTRPGRFAGRVEELIADRTTADFARVLVGRRFDAAVDFAAYKGAETRSVVESLGGGRVDHYILISTGQVYLVRNACPRPARETDDEGPLMPRPVDSVDLNEWIYGIEKRDAENVLVEAWSTQSFPSTRLRLPMVNGELDHFRRVESYLWRIGDGGPVILPDGGGHQTRHVYSGSVVAAIVAMLGNPATFGQVYNLAQDETPTLAELVTMLAELLGFSPRLAPISSSLLELVGLDHLAISPFSGRWMSFLDPSKAKTELGFQHEPLRDYLRKVVTAYQEARPIHPPANYACRAAEIALGDEI
jgi:nucleoside-diphosphate-sugar epimerase